MPNMQVLYPYYEKHHIKAALHWQMCGCILKFELNESIIKQLIKHFSSYIFYCYLASNQIVVVQYALKSQNCTSLRILYNYPEVKRLSQILYHYWTIPLSTVYIFIHC